ncbi:MAG TPA: response regulator transcription factor [Acidimicrobiales bacterium]
MALDPAPRVLVVDDDANVADVVRRYLERESFVVDVVGDGHDAIERALQTTPDLVVLDLMLPGIDGLEVCRRLRALAPVPVIMLTARGDEADRVVGLELGADDYLAKPFSPRELTARVKAVLRRARGPLSVPVPTGPALLHDDDLVVDVGAREARIDGSVVGLTARELELLVFLMRNRRRAFRREELLQEVWGYSFGDTSTVTVHVRRLREKVERDPATPTRIVTVWGIGYRWEGAA